MYCPINKLPIQGLNRKRVHTINNNLKCSSSTLSIIRMMRAPLLSIYHQVLRKSYISACFYTDDNDDDLDAHEQLLQHYKELLRIFFVMGRETTTKKTISSAFSFPEELDKGQRLAEPTG